MATITNQEKQYSKLNNDEKSEIYDYIDLPTLHVPNNKSYEFKRNVMKWFVPNVGIINMFVNPKSINHKFGKKIQKEFTKGGYVIQYWGEELPELTIQGTTASSGIEGINILYEIYRSEQLMFDNVALQIDQNQGGLSTLGNWASQAADAVGFGDLTQNIVGSITDIASDVLGVSSPSFKDITSLAELAAGIELYWSGWVFKGYFSSFTFSENADQLGLFDYTIGFTVLQRRGYRFNFLPWHRDPNSNISDLEHPKYSFNTNSAIVGYSDDEALTQNSTQLSSGNKDSNLLKSLIKPSIYQPVTKKNI